MNPYSCDLLHINSTAKVAVVILIYAFEEHSPSEDPQKHSVWMSMNAITVA